MSTQTKALVPGDVILWEEDAQYSREEKVVKTAATLAVGDICGDDSGMTGLLADAGPPVDGDAEAICLEAIVNAAAGAKVGFLVRHAKVNASNLNYGTATSEADADAALLALGIILIEEPTKQTQL